VLFGAHCSGGIKKALDKAEAMNADAVQLFVQSPRTWRFPEHHADDLEKFRARREELDMPALVHSLYLVNLAAPDDEIYRKSVETMRSTMDTACAIHADAVVFHVGSHLGAGFDAGLERVVPALEQVLERCSERTWLLLENSAGAGGTIGRSLDELALLFERLDGHPRAGFCLDSCHWWVSGVDVTDPAALDAAVDDIRGRVGLDRLRVLHVNDAAAPLGSNRDHHASLGKGEMGDALGVFLAHPSFQGLPAILETGPEGQGGPDAGELKLLRDLHRRASRRARSRRS
jgi:deoxyribonuclease IV